MDNKLTAICDPYLRFPELIGEMTDTYLDMVDTYFEDYIASDASKKCNFIDDSRIKEKLITSTLNDHIRRKLNKHKDWTLDEMIKLGLELDGGNIKQDVSDTNYVDNDKNKKIYNSNNDKIPCKKKIILLDVTLVGKILIRRGIIMILGLQIMLAETIITIIFETVRVSINFRNNQSSNNNSNNYGRNSMWHNNNNANNYDRNNAWQNNNNSNYNGRNSRWHDNSNSNNYDRNNAWHNNNNFGRNIFWSYNNQRNQNQYDD
ncbi:uncharacterized protein DDB_G0287625-like [Gordionus sp. m RMFG-2023]|uniref:uncharacterized protein DDB_G0287625-like n=1 Tax=Gordionus sp. m RMFG-2023 TaxID=3053472 RepID=UPI0031FE3AF8